MEHIALSVVSIYLFMVVGYLLKWKLKENLHEKSATYISLYALTPFLTFWGLYDREIDQTLFDVALIYVGIILVLLGLFWGVARRFFHDPQERSIMSVAGLVGNTGNLGIPLGIALFGEWSIPYTTIINLMNVFFVFTVGVYVYSRGRFEVKASLMNILKLPILWFAALAFGFHFLAITIPEPFLKSLHMGAYAAIVLQLLIFGMYLYTAKLGTLNPKLALGVVGGKFIVLPLVAIVVLWGLPLEGGIKGVLLMELMTPLAVMNVNLASLYECRPKDVTSLTFITSLLFIPLVFGLMWGLTILGWGP